MADSITTQINIKVPDDLVEVDTQNALTLYTSESDPKFMSVIFDNTTKQPVSFFFPKTLEYTEEDLTILDEDVSEWTWFESYEGTIIRMFYHNGEWKTSTRRRINSYNSYWGSNTSFGEMFDNASTGISRERLDKSLTYTFLLTSNSHNRLVCKANPTPLIFTGTFDKNGRFSTDGNVTNNPGMISLPTRTFSDSVALSQTISLIEVSALQGYLGYHAKTQRFIKVIKSEYLYLRHLRNNEPDLRARYLSTLSDPVLHRNFREHFVEHFRLFRRLDGSLHGLARDILRGTIKECDDEIFDLFNGVKMEHKSIVSWIASLNNRILWKPIIYRLKNCKTVKRDENDVRRELEGV
jgi:hypothetical protein